jgi:hypothetical protein
MNKFHRIQSSGPRWFHPPLLQKCWHVIKKYFVRMIRFVHKEKKMGGTTKSSFLALLPKDIVASSLNHFRPISLCNISYKIFSKIIANMLNPLLSSLIMSNQGGFLVGYQIWDNFILVQEEIHANNSPGDSSMAIKLDMENAFDRVEHKFLFKVLGNFGFNQSFIAWIDSCISSPWIVPLLNRRPGPFFKESRGLRQGFPLSPCFL